MIRSTLLSKRMSRSFIKEFVRKGAKCEHLLKSLFKKEDKKGREDQENAVSSTGAYVKNT
ncbi:hypothetical protein P343_01830 [Sporolactobacillus laevolacticus DSM 442]|uniref:Uncharacterized protein n=1 Tax=Sporolactobacillus laevolacticus DSM 442 TaxID=1395513 RepID=V6J1E6_9BACL|nr:hypothetical protein P343_01830 [Sporolactobacillus laevolacticus DSM 442]